MSRINIKYRVKPTGCKEEIIKNPPGISRANKLSDLDLNRIYAIESEDTDEMILVYAGSRKEAKHIAKTECGIDVEDYYLSRWKEYKKIILQEIHRRGVALVYKNGRMYIDEDESIIYRTEY